MATLEKIRNHAVILVIAIGVALMAFLMGDFLRQGTTLFNEAKTNAIVVNGEKIKIHEYQARVDQAMENYRMQSGRSSLNDMQTNQIRNQVYAQIVSERILDEQTRKLGLAVSPAETFDLVQGDFVSPVILQSAMFANPETGVYDRALMLNFLKTIDAKQMGQYSPEQQEQVRQYRNMWVNMEAMVRDYRLNEKYTGLIAKSVVANKLEIADALRAAETSASLAYVSRKAIAVSDSVAPVEDKALKAFYDGHKEFFKTEAGRYVDVIYTSILPSADDVESAHQDVLAAQKEFHDGINPFDVVTEYSDREVLESYMPLSFYRGEYFPADFAEQFATAEAGYITPVAFADNTYRVAKLVDTKVAPDSLFVRHIVLPAAGEQQGTPGIDSLKMLLQQEKADFAALAQQYSLDRNSSSRGGEIGWLTEYSASRYIDKAFAEKLFSAPVGTPVVVTSRFGQHLVLVEKATVPTKKLLVAYVSKTATAGNKTYTKVYNDFTGFLSQHKGDRHIDSLALSSGYQVLRQQPVFGMQPSIAPGIDSSRELVRWSLDNGVGKVSDIKECGDKFVIAVVRKEIKKGYLPFEEAKGQIYPIVANEAKVRYLYDEMKGANPASLSDYARSINEPVDTLKFVQFNSSRIDNLGFEPVINAAAGYAPVNKPVVLKGLAAVYLVNVIDRNQEAQKPSEDALRAMIESERANVVRMSALQNVISRATIEDNRARFY